MKQKYIITGLSALAFASAARADVTVNITGASAFRAATLQSINSRFTDSGQPFKFAHDQASGAFSGATRSIWIGTFPGVSGTTTIRCCFTGSVEGLRALTGVADPTPPTYYKSSLLNGTNATKGGAELSDQGTTGAKAISGKSDIAFSDVSKAITPFASYSLQPSSPAAGVIVFTMLTNQGSPVKNVTTQQFRAILENGFQPLSLFTGKASDTDNVFATGRNDGSGTRSTYLTETGFGVANTVKQYITIASSKDGNAITKLQLVPQGGINTLNRQKLDGQSASNASTVWGQDVAGNGGYSSGSTLRGDMGKTSSAMKVYDDTYTNSFGGKVKGYLVTWLSVNDAVSARDNGAVFCAYNGSKLSGIAKKGTTLSDTDRAKITEGQYTAWGYENMYRANSITSGDKLTVYNDIKAAIPSNLAAAGIALTDMHVGRPNDGGTVAP